MTNLDSIYDIDHRTAAFENHERGLLVSLAGPGTGKTFSLLARSAALVGRGCEHTSICYLTFIKEISSAFVDDYVERFGAESYAMSAPRISTLHSFACRLLRNLGFRYGYDGDLYFANLADVDTAAKTFLGDLLPLVNQEGCKTIPQLRAVVSDVKKGWQDSTAPTPGSLPAVVAPQLAGFARSFRLIDWDHTIPLAHTLLLELEELPSWLAKIKHYFVDEYQDFNRAEQALIGHLQLNVESMVVVGDDDQSLYGGRGGSPDGIRSLYANPTHDQVTLVKCYRCKSTIVTPTNIFQAHMNPSARPMTPATAGGQVRCLRFKSSKAEVAFLVDYLKARVGELPDGPRPKDGIVCLFPSKRILKAYFEMLSPHLPCSRRVTETSADRVWLERVLMLLMRPRQRFLERLLLNEYGDLKPRHRAMIVQRVTKRDISPSTACESVIADGGFKGNALTAAQAFLDECNRIAARELRQLAESVAARLSLSEVAVLEQLEALMGAKEEERSELIEPMCDVLLPDTAREPENPRSIMFLTMHGSKGLTRKTVVIPGLEEACLPGTCDEAELSERQRLFFVAMSRATDNLLITVPHNRGGKDSLNFAMPGRGAVSPFVASAGLVALYHE